MRTEDTTIARPIVEAVQLLGHDRKQVNDLSVAEWVDILTAKLQGHPYEAVFYAYFHDKEGISDDSSSMYVPEAILTSLYTSLSEESQHNFASALVQLANLMADAECITVWHGEAGHRFLTLAGYVATTQTGKQVSDKLVRMAVKHKLLNYKLLNEEEALERLAMHCRLLANIAPLEKLDTTFWLAEYELLHTCLPTIFTAIARIDLDKGIRFLSEQVQDIKPEMSGFLRIGMFTLEKKYGANMVQRALTKIPVKYFPKIGI